MLKRLLREFFTRTGPDSGEDGHASAQRLEALLAAGDERFRAGDRRGAEAVLREALALAPRRPEVLHALGVIAHLGGESRRAVELFETAIAEDPGNATYHSNCGEAYRALGELDKAIHCHHRAITLAPEQATAHANLGVALLACGRYSEAIGALDAAIALDPHDASAHFALAGALLVLGDYARGWREYAWRRELPTHRAAAPALEKPRWSGEHRPGATLLLHAEQGYGDAIQFVRYVPLVAERCGRVLLVCHAELDPLFVSVCGPRVELFPSGAPLPPFDEHASLLDLPELLCTTATDIPGKVPYLAAPVDRAERWSRKVESDGARLRVGIAWAGNRQHTNDRQRSCALAHFAALAPLEGVVFYVLQKESGQAGAWPADACARLIDAGPELGDFGDTAGLVANLDLVISVDTSVAHLAGALAKPVWTLLPYLPEWRWLTARDDTPWYPTMRLFRQSAAGDWDGVFSAVLAALDRELAARSR